MKRIIFASLFLLVLLSSCTVPYLLPYNFSSNPFLKKVRIDKDGSKKVISDGESISFSVITDSHFRRKDSSWFNDNYYEFLEEKDYPFAINLGDFTDTGVITTSDLEFLGKVKSYTTCDFVTVTMGNHDRHNLSSFWDNGDEGFTSAGCYYYGELQDGTPLLAIYKIDTSADNIGYKQFEHLEEALKKETAVYRIILSHENVSIGNALSPTLVIFGLGSEETNKLYKLMSQYNVSLILSGHNHIGNIAYHLSDTLGELNLAAYHRKVTKPVQIESMGCWYDFTLNTDSGMAVITSYSAETKEKEKSFSFRLARTK